MNQRIIMAIMAATALLFGAEEAVLPLGKPRPPDGSDDVDVTAGNDVRCVSGLNVSVPDGALLKRLGRDQDFLQLLPISSQGQQSREFSACVRAINIYA